MIFFIGLFLGLLYHSITINDWRSITGTIIGVAVFATLYIVQKKEKKEIEYGSNKKR